MSSAIAIVNPTSRDGATMRIWTKVRTLLNENGFDDIIELQTTRPGHAAELANEYHDYDGLILAVGGDGTAHEVASGLRGGKTVLGIVPTGSGNDLARTHEIPPLDPKGIVDVIVNGVDRPVPAMRIEALPAPPIGNYPIPKPHSWDGEPENEGRIVRWAFQESDVGLTAAVSRSKFVRAKWLRGTLKYTYLGIREIIAWKRRKIRLICDEDSQEIDFVLGAMMIGETFGGGYRAFPGANPRLKGMGMIYGTGLGKLKMMTLMGPLHKGKHIGKKGIYDRRVQEVKLELADKRDKPIIIQADGEPCMQLPAHITWHPNQIHIRGASSLQWDE